MLQAHGVLLDSIVRSVSSWPCLRAPQARAEKSNDAIPGSGKQEKSFSKTPSEPDGLSSLHTFVIAREPAMKLTLR
ncbi:hypothetical protein ACFIOY_15955 [Bradyrhizobium sp. TZ2]